MLALYRSGRQADALRAFQRARTVLGDELGLEPGPALRELERQILEHDPALGAVASVTSAPPTNIFPEMGAFVGRDDRCSELAAAIAERRLVTIIGHGGVGKTRLAIETAQRINERFAGGTWLVELGSEQGRERWWTRSCARSVTGWGARVTCRTPSGSPAGSARPSCWWCSTTASTCSPTRQPRCRRCCGRAHRCACWPPAASRSGCPANEYAGWSRCTRQRRPSCSPPVRSTPTARSRPRRRRRGHRCDLPHVDGLPLAIELAAARTRTFTVQQLEGLLRERLSLLGAPGAARPARQQTLQAAVAWSFDLLSDDERHLFARLSVFAGGFTLRRRVDGVLVGGGAE